MVQLREEDEGGETPDWAHTALQSQLRQAELDWSSLLADVPAFRTALQEVRTRDPGPGTQDPGPQTPLSQLVSSCWFCLLSAA